MVLCCSLSPAPFTSHLLFSTVLHFIFNRCARCWLTTAKPAETPASLCVTAPEVLGYKMCRCNIQNPQLGRPFLGSLRKNSKVNRHKWAALAPSLCTEAPVMPRSPPCHLCHHRMLPAHKDAGRPLVPAGKTDAITSITATWQEPVQKT